MKLGSNGLEMWWGKVCTARSGVKIFIRGFYIRIFIVRYVVKNCLS